MLITLDNLQEESKVVVGVLFTVVVVKAANVAKDIRENLRNLTGGRMKHYEQLIQSTVDEALKELEQKAKNQGYDGVIGVKISNPMVVEGGAEIIVYGNGFKKLS